MSNTLDSIWIEAYRPKTLKHIVLSKEDRRFFEGLATKQEIPHLLFAGVQGTGKTSLSKIVVNDILNCQYLYVNTSEGGGNIDSIRGIVANFAKTKSIDGKIKVVLLDECDSASAEGQRALRGIIEDYAESTRFILTCNYLFKVIAPIQSRCQLINLNPPAEGVVERVVHILKNESVTIPPEQKPLLLKHIQKNLPDLRRIINDIQKFSITGTLLIKEDSGQEFAETVFKKVLDKEDLTSLRKYIIENEREFSNDYRHLLKQLFEVVFACESLQQAKKTEFLLTLSESMYRDAIVVDKEINCFTALINLSRSISSND